MPSTNLLSMPLSLLTVETGTNEDWIDSLKYLVETDGLDEADWPQLDIRNINFYMEVRRAPPDHEVIISASTDDGTLVVGDPPDYGFLIINVGIEDMQIQQPGKYVADIRGVDDVNTRVVVQIDLTLIEGITR